MQLATLLVGLIAATALWSGVLALNSQARDSYDRAAAAFGAAPPRCGRPRQPDLPAGAVRRAAPRRVAGVAGARRRVTVNGRGTRLIGIEPLSLPQGAGPARISGRATCRLFSRARPHAGGGGTLADLGLREGDAARLDASTVLPPLSVQRRLAPGVLVVDIGVAQRLLKMPDQVSRLLLPADDNRARPALADVAGDRLRRVEAGAPSDLERLTASFHLNLTTFGLLSFVVGLFIVHSAIGLALEQRLPMLRTMRACGVSARQLTWVLVGELVTLAVLSGIAGLVCGYVVAAWLLPDVAASLRGLYGAQLPGELSLRAEWWLSGLA